eukprot:jgi/Botrbrau1/22378/Bobra.0002s0055.1
MHHRVGARWQSHADLLAQYSNPQGSVSSRIIHRTGKRPGRRKVTELSPISDSSLPQTLIWLQLRRTECRCSNPTPSSERGEGLKSEVEATNLPLDVSNGHPARNGTQGRSPASDNGSFDDPRQSITGGRGVDGFAASVPVDNGADVPLDNGSTAGEVQPGGGYVEGMEKGLSDPEKEGLADDLQQEGDSNATASVRERTEEVIAGGPGAVSLEALETTFKFPLDNFQRKAVSKFLQGSSVVVCAPTGAGKTAIAEAAAVAVLAEGRRVIYTTPLKALSNQKVGEMRERFGTERVGLQTGDVSLNADGEVVVMTTEVLRNIMYRVVDADEGPIQDTDRLEDVGLIVLDEVHYLGDPDRGSVWEEVIINCPKSIRMLCMSATVANPDELGGWISQVHGACATVKTTFRPVPLTWHFARNRRGGKTELLPLLDPHSGTLHPAMSMGSRGRSLLEDSYSDDAFFGALSGRRRGSSRGKTRYLTMDDLDVKKRRRRKAGEEEEEEEEEEELSPTERVPPLKNVVKELAGRDLLPAIVFIFSRAGCDEAARLSVGAGLASPEETALILAAVENLRSEQPEAVREDMVPALLEGVASHHAGCLPAWKALVESLFQRAILKVVYATETLAAGINMPARTTVISSVSKRRDEGHGLLKHNELLQMAGRAGRRGYDTVGNCVVVQSRFEEAGDAVGIIARGPEPLASQFSTSYSMVTNLLSTRTLDEARAFISRSFNNYLGGEGQVRKLRKAESLETRARDLLEEAEAVAGRGEADASWNTYVKHRDLYQAFRAQLADLATGAAVSRSHSALQLLRTLGLPRMVEVEEGGPEGWGGASAKALLVCEVEKPSPDDADVPWFLAIRSDNRVLQVPVTAVVAASDAVEEDGFGDLEGVLDSVVAAAELVGQWMLSGGGFYYAAGSGASAKAALNVGAWRGSVTRFSAEEEVEEQLEELRSRVSAERRAAKKAKAEAAALKDLRQDLQLRAKATGMLKKAQTLREGLQGPLQSTWRSFEDVTKVLAAAGALKEETLTPAPLGEVIRHINGLNELWLAKVLTHPSVQTLAPRELAGVMAVMVTAEVVTRLQISAAYPPSQAVIDCVQAMEAERTTLAGLQIRHQVNVPLEIDMRLAGVVESWAAGNSWDQVVKDCTLDDGDVARLLSRTADLLKQAMHCPVLLTPLRDTARKAVKAMTRKPIRELLI